MSFGIVAGVVGSVAGAVITSRATKKAGEAQKAGTDGAIEEQGRQYDLTRADFAPYRQTGVNALSQLAGDIDKPLSSAEVMSEPGYQFGMQQGQQAIDRKIASGGGRVSGQAIKAAARFGTDYATTGYGQAYQRRQDRLNRLAALAGIGQTSTAQTGAFGANAANQIGGAMQSAGDNAGAARLQQGSIWGNTANQIAALYGRGQQQQSPFSGYGGSGDGYGVDR